MAADTRTVFVECPACGEVLPAEFPLGTSSVQTTCPDCRAEFTADAGEAQTTVSAKPFAVSPGAPRMDDHPTNPTQAARRPAPARPPPPARVPGVPPARPPVRKPGGRAGGGPRRAAPRRPTDADGSGASAVAPDVGPDDARRGGSRRSRGYHPDVHGAEPIARRARRHRALPRGRTP